MELSDSHKILQEKRDFKIIDVLITAWSRVQVLPGPSQKEPRLRLGFFLLFRASGLEEARPPAGGNRQPSGLSVSARVPTARNVYQESCRFRSTFCCTLFITQEFCRAGTERWCSTGRASQLRARCSDELQIGTPSGFSDPHESHLSEAPWPWR